MNNLLKSKAFYLFLIVAILVGICIGLPFDLKKMSLKLEVDIVGLCDIVVTIILALFITNALEKKVQDNRVEKELFIAQVGKIEEFASDLKSLLSSPPIYYSKVNNIIGRCRIKKNNVLKAIQDQFKLTEDKTYKQLSTQISEALNRIKNSMTKTEIGSRDISLKNDVVTYSKTRNTVIYKEIDQFENYLFQLTIYLNSL